MDDRKDSSVDWVLVNVLLAFVDFDDWHGCHAHDVTGHPNRNQKKSSSKTWTMMHYAKSSLEILVAFACLVHASLRA
jgi:hypothetical protein